VNEIIVLNYHDQSGYLVSKSVFFSFFNILLSYNKSYHKAVVGVGALKSTIVH